MPGPPLKTWILLSKHRKFIRPGKPGLYIAANLHIWRPFRYPPPATHWVGDGRPTTELEVVWSQELIIKIPQLSTQTIITRSCNLSLSCQSSTADCSVCKNNVCLYNRVQASLCQRSCRSCLVKSLTASFFVFGMVKINNVLLLLISCIMGSRRVRAAMYFTIRSWSSCFFVKVSPLIQFCGTE